MLGGGGVGGGGLDKHSLLIIMAGEVEEDGDGAGEQ